MNANELADEVMEHYRAMLPRGFNVNWMQEAATMLRQQQAEIESLKANRKHDFGLGEASGFIKGHKENPYKAITNTKIEPTVVSYTHPVKELTDEEIKFIAYPFESVYTTYDKQTDTDTVHTRFDQLGFARAILRKAQE